MIFLLTNDDGINSPKLRYTQSILKKFGTVYLIAPKEEQSAKSMSLTIGGFNFNKIDDFTYSIEGTPVDCVNFAFGALNLRPDIVFSGTNNGYNIGIDTRYSGTVGACLQAQYFGASSVALSCGKDESIILEKELEPTIKYILDNTLYTNEYTLNINFPNDKFGTSKGLLTTELDYYLFEYKPEIIGNKYKPNRRYIEDKNIKKNTDTYAYLHGYTSISKIKV